MTSELHVVLDANVLVGDWLLESAAGQAVLNEAASGRIRVCVPDVVLREVERKYRRELKAADRHLRDAIRARLRLAAGAPDSALNEVAVGIDAGAAAASYSSALRARFAEADALVIPLPTVPHAEVLERALAGRRPFDEDGRAGYRDALIWHNVLDLAQAASAIVLVSNDRDFADPSGELRKELRDESVAQPRPGPGTVALCKNLSELIVNYFPKESGLLFEVNERLRSDRRFFSRVREQLDSAWIGAAPDLDIDGDIELDWSDYELDMVNDVFDDFVATHAADAGQGRAFVKLRAHADVQVKYEIPISSAVTSHGEAAEGVEIYEGRWGAHGEFVDVIPAELTFEAFYSSGRDCLTEVSLERVAESWEWVEAGRLLGGPPPG